MTTIATLHHYRVSTTVELTEETQARLGNYLEELSRASAPEQKYHCGVVWGKTGETPVENFRPITIKDVEFATEDAE